MKPMIYIKEDDGYFHPQGMKPTMYVKLWPPARLVVGCGMEMTYKDADVPYVDQLEFEVLSHKVIQTPDGPVDSYEAVRVTDEDDNHE